jgi:hypothetical protein
MLSKNSLQKNDIEDGKEEHVEVESDLRMEGSIEYHQECSNHANQESYWHVE